MGAGVGWGLLPGSRAPSLSGRHWWAGEGAGASRGLQGEGVGRSGGGGHPAGAARVSVVELPQQLLVLHGQAFVDFGLFLEGLLQRGLLRRQLPVMHRHGR